ncbi:MAG: diguanylate cyclase [Candidatus Electronema sp. V4]|uniref:diguanylate cyclase n=1 Tax=Candidatus Electronema sp. V4 TaxID=3454756 RepID=UPI0040553E51
MEYARLEARANFNKDMALRAWAAKHGGVYVPAAPDTPPNPYLSHLPERDVLTTSGKRLTLMNPAYMLRQVMNDFSGQYGIRGRITSLRPLNPINAPDAWELRVLRQFEQGVTEVSELTEIGGEPYLRYMRAFRTQEDCLKCHRRQGYKQGDVRGGIGVSVPLRPYMEIRQRATTVLAVSYGLLWLLGCAGLLGVNRFVRRQILLRRGMEAELLKEKERLELVLEGTGLGLWDWNPQTGQVVFDSRWAEILGCEPHEIAPNMESWQARVHPDDLPACLQAIHVHFAGRTEYYSHIHRIRHQDGSWRYILDRGRVVERDADGQPLRFTGTHTDVTALKETETALREKSAELARLNEILAHQAMYDGLTHVRNRRAFDQQLNKEWRCWLLSGKVFSLLIADIDFFKSYNDTYGHLEGDTCLRAVAQTLAQSAARASDFTARYGGEEFVILLPGAELEQALLVAEKARQAVEQLALPHPASSCAKVVTLSVGAAAVSQLAENEASCSGLLALADQALYAAKKGGRNRVATAS